MLLDRETGSWNVINSRRFTRTLAGNESENKNILNQVWRDDASLSVQQQGKYEMVNVINLQSLEGGRPFDLHIRHPEAALRKTTM